MLYDLSERRRKNDMYDMPGTPMRRMKYDITISLIIKKVAEDCIFEAVEEVKNKTNSTDLTAADRREGLVP